jgi:hypothetical protein
MKGTGRASLNLKSSICTDNPTGADTYDFNSEPAQIVQNTGIERNGGVSTIYEQETTFATAGANSIITESGDLLQVDASNNVRLNNNILGNVGDLSISIRGTLGNYDDAAWTADGTIIAIRRQSLTAIVIDEINPTTKLVIHTRTLTFAGVSDIIVNTMLVKYVDMHYSDNQEILSSIVITAAVYGYLYRESGLSVNSVSGGPFCIYNYMWRFGTNKYLWGRNGSVGTHEIGDPIAGGTLFTDAKWVTILRKGLSVYSQALLTFDPYKTAGNMLSGYALVGYSDAIGTWSTTELYDGIALAAVTVVIVNPICGPGYSECTFTRSDTGTNIYSYIGPGLDSTASAFYSNQTQTHTPANAYGRIGDRFINELVKWRMIMIAGVPSMISASSIHGSFGSTRPCMGVPITNVGEVDPTFLIQVDDSFTNATFSRILYKYGNNLFYVEIYNNSTHPISKISNTTYLINCLSPINLVDMATGQLTIGPNDYNGRVLFKNTGAILSSSKKFVARQSSNLTNSVDPGDRLITMTPIYTASGNLFPAIEPPAFVQRTTQCQIDTFINDLYDMSYISYYQSVENHFYDTNLDQLLYVPDTRLPIAMGYSYGDKVVLTDTGTILLGVGQTGVPEIDYDYAGYELGNDIAGLYQSFYLFGQRYLFDGFQIWLTTFNGSLYQTKYFICPATGLQLIAVSPTLAYFLSTFDNSIYTFDGGRSVQKTKRMNDLRNSSNGIETIINGVYNVRDDTLLLQTANTFVWVRDGIVTQNNKKATQTSLTLFDTTQGIQIANNTLKWTYDFNTRGTTTTTGGTAVTTVVPLTWQSAYHALKGNELSIAHNWVVTVYHPEGLAPVPITLRCHAFDQDTYTLQRADLTINPSDWDGLGFYRARIQPKNRRALASSLQIDTTQHIVITDVSVEYADETQAVIAGQRSR